MVLLRTVHWKVLWGTKTGSFYMASLWKPPFGTFIFKEFSHIVYSYLSSPIWALFSCLLSSCVVSSTLFLSFSCVWLISSFFSLFSSHLSLSPLLCSCLFSRLISSSLCSLSRVVFTSLLISSQFLFSYPLILYQILFSVFVSSHPISVLLLVSSHLSFSYFTFILSHHSFLSPLLFYSHFILVCFFFFFFILSHHSFLVPSSPLLSTCHVSICLFPSLIWSYLVFSHLLYSFIVSLFFQLISSHHFSHLIFSTLFSLVFCLILYSCLLHSYCPFLSSCLSPFSLFSLLLVLSKLILSYLFD